MEHLDELKQIATLQELSLGIQRHSYKWLNVHPFLYKMHELKMIEFVAEPNMTENEVEIFASQQIVSNWRFETKIFLHQWF